jgi:hypothetical protein
MRAVAAALALLTVLASTAAAAGDVGRSPNGNGRDADVGRSPNGNGRDADVDLIPESVLESQNKPAPTPAATQFAPLRTTFHGKFFVEDAFSAWSAPALADAPVPYPANLAIGWQNRASFDTAIQWRPRKDLTLTLSDRINLFEQDGQKLVSADTLRNDLREASVAWEPLSNWYLEAGRINVRNGAALGFSPTDFFKTRTLVGQASLDPSVIRQNRLGTWMLRAQRIWSGGSASIAYAPKLAEPSPVLESNPLGIDPRFDTTNAAHRVLCTVSLDVLDLSPQLLGYFELHRSKLGANVSRTFGDAVVGYAEWAGGPEVNVIARAFAFGENTGTLPPNAPRLPPTSTNVLFRNDVAAGFSWTVASAITFNAEYHYHDAGFTRTDWRNWFNLGSSPNVSPALTGELWFVRGYANDQQEPVTQHEAFVRASWPRALVPELELSAFAFVDLLDASVLTQLSASYYISGAWTASAYGAANLGEGRSERGSLPQRLNAILQLTRYL